MITISPEDLGWLSDNHPDLVYIDERKQVVGELDFRMYYDQKIPDKYIINPTSKFALEDKRLVTDVYEITIDFNSNTKIPDAFETGGRIEASAEKWGIESLIDLHVYPNRSLCLCIPLEWDIKLPNGFNLADYFTNLLIPYFYYQSFFEKYGEEPWKGYAHGDIGLLESFHRRALNNKLSNEIVEMYFEGVTSNLKKKLNTRRMIKGHHLCFCGSGQKIRNCHREAQFGFNSLNEYHYLLNK